MIKYGIPVDITLFEDKSFEYQIEFNDLYHSLKMIVSQRS